MKAKRWTSFGAVAGLALAAISQSAAADDLKISQLEQDVRELRGQLQQQARRIEYLENALRQSRPGSTPLPERPVINNAETSKQWMVSANWDKVHAGMTEAEVVRLLGMPTTSRTSQADPSRTLFYAMELDGGGFLSGQIVVAEQRVVEIRKPALK